MRISDWSSDVCSSDLGGGVVRNDYFDAALDAVERPERPIPREDISKKQAGIFGAVLLLLGIIFSFFAGILPGILAISIAVLVVLYDVRMNSHSLFGPLNLGLCRAVNLLLGISVVPALTGRMARLGLDRKGTR